MIRVARKKSINWAVCRNPLVKKPKSGSMQVWVIPAILNVMKFLDDPNHSPSGARDSSLQTWTALLLS